MSDGLSAAIVELETELRRQLQEASSTKKLINSLLIRMGKEPRYVDVEAEGHTGKLRPDQYYGKPLATAAQMVLERIGQAATAEEILKGLVQGGFDFRPLNWGDKVRMRNLAISLAKNVKAFHKLPNGTFGLTEWYDKEILRKAGKATKDKLEDEAGKIIQPEQVEDKVDS